MSRSAEQIATFQLPAAEAAIRAKKRDGGLSRILHQECTEIATRSQFIADRLHLVMLDALNKPIADPGVCSYEMLNS